MDKGREAHYSSVYVRFKQPLIKTSINGIVNSASKHICFLLQVTPIRTNRLFESACENIYLFGKQTDYIYTTDRLHWSACQ